MATNFRGVMLQHFCSVEMLTSALDRGVNLFRYPIWLPEADPRLTDVALYNEYLTAHIRHIKDFVLPTIEGRAKLVIVNFCPAGGLLPKRETRMFYDPTWAEVFAQAWERIATQFNGLVFGYDVLNEPRGTGPQVGKMMRAVAARVRAIDKAAWLVIEPPFGLASRITNSFNIGKMGNVLYSCHMYAPGTLTHAGIGSNPNKPIAYPSRRENKEKLKTYLKPLRDFQRMNSAKIYIGEFSCGVPAGVDARAAWLKDCISLFETYGWQWSYHAWREADCWNAEPFPKVLQVLTDGWRKNK